MNKNNTITKEQAIDALMRVKIRREGHNLQDEDTEKAFELAITALQYDPNAPEQHIIEVEAACDQNENKAKDEKKIDVKTAIGYLEHWKYLSTYGMGKKIMIDEAYVEVLEMAIFALRQREPGA